MLFFFMFENKKIGPQPTHNGISLKRYFSDKFMIVECSIHILNKKKMCLKNCPVSGFT